MVKYIFITIIFFHQALSAKPWTEVYAESTPAIPIIFQAGGVCSGSLIEPQLILTAAHCVAHIRELSVMFQDQKGVYYTATVEALDTENDLALISINKSLKRPLLKLYSDDKQILPGTPVATIGHPTNAEPFKNPAIDLASTYLISAGVVSKYIQKDYIVDLSVSPGNSGGPLLNNNGEIIGVISRKRADRLAGDIGYATNHDKIQQFIDRYNNQDTEKITALSARSRLGISLQYSYHSFLESFSEEHDDLWALSLDFALLGRIALQGTISAWDSRSYYENYGLGYIIYVPLPNRMVLYFTPMIERFKYDLDQKLTGVPEVIERGTGGSIYFGATSLPLSLKYSRFDLNGQEEDVLTFRLSF